MKRRKLVGEGETGAVEEIGRKKSKMRNEADRSLKLTVGEKERLSQRKVVRNIDGKRKGEDEIQIQEQMMTGKCNWGSI